MAIRFDGKVAIVTGAGGGLGRAHALEFARRGAKVVVNDLGGTVDGSGGTSNQADKVAREITEAGGEAIANGASVTDDEGVAGLIEQAMSAYGRIDILVNNAGILRDRTHSQHGRSQDFEAVINVHLSWARSSRPRRYGRSCGQQEFGRVDRHHVVKRAVRQFRTIELRRRKAVGGRSDQYPQA